MDLSDRVKSLEIELDYLSRLFLRFIDYQTTLNEMGLHSRQAKGGDRECLEFKENFSPLHLRKSLRPEQIPKKGTPRRVLLRLERRLKSIRSQAT